MTQTARPTSDAHVGNWEDDGGGVVNLYLAIDEVTPDDGSYAISDAAPSSSPYVCGLGTVTDPVTSSGHLPAYRIGKNLSGGAQIDITLELRQGYISEASPGTLIKQWAHTNVDALTTYQPTLSAAEADSITDYSDLYYRFVADTP